MPTRRSLRWEAGSFTSCVVRAAAGRAPMTRSTHRRSEAATRRSTPRRTTVPEPAEEGMPMKSWWPRACLAGMALTFVLATPGRADQTSTDELKQEIDALKAMLQSIQKDLQEVKGMLARQVPPPTGVGTVLDLGAAPVKGEKTAKLTLVEFSDYQ